MCARRAPTSLRGGCRTDPYQRPIPDHEHSTTLSHTFLQAEHPHISEGDLGQIPYQHPTTLSHTFVQAKHPHISEADLKQIPYQRHITDHEHSTTLSHTLVHAEHPHISEADLEQIPIGDPYPPMSTLRRSLTHLCTQSTHISRRVICPLATHTRP